MGQSVLCSPSVPLLALRIESRGNKELTWASSSVRVFSGKHILTSVYQCLEILYKTFVCACLWREEPELSSQDS